MEYIYLFLCSIMVYIFYNIFIKYVKYTYEMKQLQFKLENTENKTEARKPERFKSLLKDKKSRLEQIIDCKNS